MGDGACKCLARPAASFLGGSDTSPFRTSSQDGIPRPPCSLAVALPCPALPASPWLAGADKKEKKTGVPPGVPVRDRWAPSSPRFSSVPPMLLSVEQHADADRARWPLLMDGRCEC